MKKTILISALFIGLLITSSGFNRTSLNTSIGKNAPALASSDLENIIEQSENDGQFTLLSFWAANDALSRKSTIDYDLWLNRNDMFDNVNLLAINFDKSEPLFREIVRRDGLSSDSQYNVSGDIAKAIIRDYHLDKGYGSILIDPEGTIVAHNPSVDDIARLTTRS